MKKLFCFLAVAATAAFTSCSSDDDSGNNGENPGNEVTAITLTASATSVEVGTAVTFNVVDQDGDAVTNATLAANGNAITSPWTAETAGEYTVVATLGTLTSSVTVTVTEAETIVEPENSIVIDNVNYIADNSTLYFQGADDNGFNYWVANFYQIEGEGENATYPNDIYVYFVTAPEAGPTVSNMVFNGETTPTIIDVRMLINNNDILPWGTTNEEVQGNAAARAALLSDFTFNITSITPPENGIGTFTNTYGGTINEAVTNGAYSGNFGFIDLTADDGTEGRGITNSSKTFLSYIPKR